MPHATEGNEFLRGLEEEQASQEAGENPLKTDIQRGLRHITKWGVRGKVAAVLLGLATVGIKCSKWIDAHRNIDALQVEEIESSNKGKKIIFESDPIGEVVIVATEHSNNNDRRPYSYDIARTDDVQPGDTTRLHLFRLVGRDGIPEIFSVADAGKHPQGAKAAEADRRFENAKLTPLYGLQKDDGLDVPTSVAGTEMLPSGILVISVRHPRIAHMTIPAFAAEPIQNGDSVLVTPYRIDGGKQIAANEEKIFRIAEKVKVGQK